METLNPALGTRTPHLELLFEELRALHFGAELPLPTLRWNPRMSSTAGRFSPGYRWAPKPLIEVAKYLCDHEEGQRHVRDTLLHEMIHYYLWWQGKPYGHTEEFYQIMKRTGASRFNTVPKLRPIKYWYQCLACKTQVPARRKLGIVACLACCKKHNQGRFSRNFILEIYQGSLPCSKPPQLAEECAFLEPQEFIQRLKDLQTLVRNSSIRKT